MSGHVNPLLARGRRAAAIWIGALLAAPAPAWGALPAVTGYPAISSNTVIADNTTPYTVTMTVTDSDGFNDIRCVRILFNYTESTDGAIARGYFVWGATDADATQYGGAYTMADATGGGRWGYRTDALGGTSYTTPISGAMTTAGSASGGSGSRTVTFTMTVKAAWAFNPVMNDADVWVADYSSAVGWLDNPASFDVVKSACTNVATTPRAPVTSGVTSTTVNLAVDPTDSSTDLFAIQIAPSMNGKCFVQADGTLGTQAAWRLKSAWGTTTVAGLLWNATYSFSLRATKTATGDCPSAWSPVAQVTTLDYIPTIPIRGGTVFNPGVRGQCPYRQISTTGYPLVWDMTLGSCGRGLAGGLDADTYDWRDIYSGSNWGQGGGRFTTLEFLRYARDHLSAAMLTANAFGGGYRDDANGGVFVCQTVNPEGLAADWVRYTNVVLQNYRQGQEGELTGDDARVHDAITGWDTRPRLLAPAEGVTPRVAYWEIGNEPELGGYGDFLTSHYLGPTDYRDRYKLMAQAMLAVDPTIKIGPCLMDPSAGSSQWLDALASDSAAPIGFVAYHPYYSGIKSAWGNTDAMRDALRKLKTYMHGKAAGIRTLMTSRGRTAYELCATEWNPVNWDAGSQLQASMAMALGIVESVFGFAEDEVSVATFWEQPQSKLGAARAFTELTASMGDTLLCNIQQWGLNPDNVNWRVYASKSAAQPNRIFIWGLNFSETDDVTLTLRLGPCRISTATLRRLGLPAGNTSLMTYSAHAWTQQDITAGFNTAQFPLSIAHAEITLLILDVIPLPKADFDRDGDVDQVDFGYFQSCLSGAFIPQTATACADARLDPGDDVDSDDFTIFAGCMRGADVTADPACAP